MMCRFLILCLVASPLAAATLAPPPCPTCRPGVWQIQFDFLYLTISSCDHTYAIEDERPFSQTATPDRLPEGKSLRVNPDGGLGFRMSLGYLIEGCTKDLTLIYTTLSNGNEEIETPFEPAAGFWPVFAHPRYMEGTPIYSPNLTDQDPATVLGDASFDWDAVEWQFGRRLYQSCRTILRGFLSLYYVHLRNGFRASYQGFEDPSAPMPTFLDSLVDFHGKSWGVGPRLGFDLYTRVWCGLGIAGHFGVGLLSGRTESKMFERDLLTRDGAVVTDQLLNVFDQGRPLVFPNFSGGLAANYTYICENFFAFIAEVGYEYTSYVNAVREPIRYNDKRGTRPQGCANFDASGVYVSFKVRM